MNDVTPIVAALGRSGFPLQTRVEHEIQARVPNGWRLLASEYPWRDPDKGDQFIDLIACFGWVVLVVECKRAQERSLLFLRPLGAETTGFVKDVTAWHVERIPERASDHILREGIKLEPESYQTRFCVSGEKSGQRLLEQDARPVVLAAEQVAINFSRAALPSRAFIVPVILTTAPLFTLRYQPSEIALETGAFGSLDPSRIEPIRWVRFYKSFTVRPDNRPRTVLVVNSSALGDFLAEISQGQG